MVPLAARYLTGIASVVVWLCLAGGCVAAESPQALKERARNSYRGLGTEQSYAKALQLYLQAARQGDNLLIETDLRTDVELELVFSPP